MRSGISNFFYLSPEPRAHEPRAWFLTFNEPRAQRAGTGLNPVQEKLCFGNHIALRKQWKTIDVHGVKNPSCFEILFVLTT